MRLHWKSVAGWAAFSTAATACTASAVWWWLWRGLLPPRPPVSCRHGCCWPPEGMPRG